jgi:threonine/homoserine/homoserine lactone efflux protein
MTPEAWVALATVFILGAMSPGPSLAVILSNTMSGGRRQGVATGIGHGIGFGIYAFLAALGLATALSVHDGAQLALRWGGVAILLWLGASFIRSSRRGLKSQEELSREGPSDFTGFIQGFMIALFNPKILAWMLALYAPFIDDEVSIDTLLGMGALGMVIDGSWYVTVATFLSSGDRINRLRSNAHIIDGCMGVLMFVFAGLLASGWF